MSAKLLKTLTASHLNALNATVQSLETQVAALKTVLKGVPNDDTEESEEVEESAPKKRGRPKKEKAVEEEEDEDFSDVEPTEEEDESDDGESEDDDFEEQEEKPAPKKSSKGPTLADVIKALQVYSTEHSRKDAMKKLGKFKVKSVHDLNPKHFGDLIESLE